MLAYVLVSTGAWWLTCGADTGAGRADSSSFQPRGAETGGFPPAWDASGGLPCRLSAGPDPWDDRSLSETR
uniref:Putative secreted protein n=1 Tax=Ixodes ricinus TaxID=34613 RepID=A0A6B0TXN6_IXORI